MHPKVEEIYAPDLQDFVYITDGASTAEDVKACELKILAALNFNVTRPHSLHFLRRNSKAGDANQEQHTLAKFMMECTIGEYELARQPPSLVAAASLLLALKLTNAAEVITIDARDRRSYSSPGDLFSIVEQQLGVLLHLHLH